MENATTEEKKRKWIYDRIPHDRVQDPAALARELKWRVQAALGPDEEEEEEVAMHTSSGSGRASKKRKLTAGVEEKQKRSIVFASPARTKNFQPR